MKPLSYVSFAGLALMFVAACLHFSGVLAMHTYYVLAFVGTVIWFATVPFWMKRRLGQEDTHGS